MNIVFLDIKSIGEDIDLSMFDRLGNVIRYPFSSPEEVPERIADADVIVLNKVPVNAQTIGRAKRLKLVCVTATGTDNLDLPYLEKREVAWRNVAGYSTESVAQHTFAMLFYLLEKLHYYDRYVKDGRYVNDTLFTHFGERFHELHHMTWGIIGLGNIGRRVAAIASCFGADVIYCSPSGSAPQPGYRQTDLSTLLTVSDIVSVHAPLNTYTDGLLGADAFARMKPSAILLNLGRGPIVQEQALFDALQSGQIAAAGLDVLTKEPMRPDNPLLSIQDSQKLLITPHIGWASVEARTRLMEIIAEQIRQFFE